MAPVQIEKAEGVVIEGSEIVRERAVKIALDLIARGKANLMVVAYQDSEIDRPNTSASAHKGSIFRPPSLCLWL